MPEKTPAPELTHERQAWPGPGPRRSRASWSWLAKCCANLAYPKQRSTTRCPVSLRGGAAVVAVKATRVWLDGPPSRLEVLMLTSAGGRRSLIQLSYRRARS